MRTPTQSGPLFEDDLLASLGRSVVRPWLAAATVSGPAVIVVDSWGIGCSWRTEPVAGNRRDRRAAASRSRVRRSPG